MAKKLYKRLLRVVLIPPLGSLERNKECLSSIKQTLASGVSVCIFIDNLNIQQEIQNLNNSPSFQEILHPLQVPLIPVTIEKGSKEKHHRIFNRLYQKFRVPATLFFGEPIEIGH